MMKKVKSIELEACEVKDRIFDLRRFITEMFLEDCHLEEITLRFEHYPSFEGEYKVVERVFHRTADDWICETIVAYVPDSDSRSLDYDVQMKDAYLEDAWQLDEWSEDFFLDAA